MFLRLDEPGTATAGRRRQPVAGPRRPPRPHPLRPEAAPVREPHWAEVPDWSEGTLEKLGVLTPLEQAVVIWRVAGHSGAEAYRRATGRDSPSARQSASQILRRPEVAAAVAAGLKDRNFAARLDLEWFIQKLHWVIVTCQDERTAGHMNTLCNAITLMAKLQGEWPGSRRWSPRRPAPPESATPSAAMKRIEEIVAEATRRAAAARAAAPPPPMPPAVGDAPVSEPAEPVEPVEPTQQEEPVFARPHLAPDGLPIGVVRPFIPPSRPARPAAGEPGPVEPVRDGPLVPRVPAGPIKYQGSSRYFLGCWA
jgi:hypothetical protein